MKIEARTVAIRNPPNLPVASGQLHFSSTGRLAVFVESHGRSLVLEKSLTAKDYRALGQSLLDYADRIEKDA